PGALVILVLSVLYAVFHELPLVQALFFGVKAAVLAVVIEAVFRIGRRALKTSAMYTVAALAFIGIFFFEMPFPLIVLAAALVGFVGHRINPTAFKPMAHHAAGAHAQSVPALDALLDAGLLEHVKPSAARAALIALTCLILWFGPLLAIGGLLGPQSVYLAEGLFFSKMAVVTFGGAYAVLAYVAQQAVEFYAWLSPGEMLDGLGMAETTPGPLILVLEFVGFLAAFRNPGPFDPLLAGVLGAFLTLWVTFVPCFLWIFLGAPYVEALRGRQGLNAALSAITAAVVGVVLNLAIWFAVHVAFGTVGERHLAGLRLLVPDWSTVNMPAVVLAGAAFVALFGFRQGMLRILAVCALLGAVWHYLIG
ncbi:MAG: chromate transporter, partial [Alphaproteobacteria bacterium]